MTEEEFFKTHQILYRKNNKGHEFMILDLRSGDTIKKYNYDYSCIDPVLFEFFIGRSLNDEIVESVASEIKSDFKVDLIG